MADKNSNELDNYYIIKFERYIDLLTEIEQKYNILADLLHDEVLKTLPEFWDNTPISTITDCYVNIKDIRAFLDEKVNNPSDEEVKLANKYNIKDVLISKQDLQKMNVLLLANEDLEDKLFIEYKISLVTH